MRRSTCEPPSELIEEQRTIDKSPSMKLQETVSSRSMGGREREGSEK